MDATESARANGSSDRVEDVDAVSPKEMEVDHPIVAEAEKQASALTRLHKKPYRFSSYAREDHGKAIYCIGFCDALPQYEKIFATAGGERVSVYECLEDGGLDVLQVYIDEDDEEQFFALSWSVDVLTGCPLLAVAGYRGHIKVMNIITQTVVTVLSGHGNSVNELKFHPVDPSLLLSASKDESIRLWNTLTGVCIAIFAGHLGHRDEVLSVDIHMTGSAFVSSGMDNTVKIWDLEDAGVQTAITKSYKEPRPADRPFETKFVQFPAYCTSKVHADYVDCVRFIGDLVLSKSTGNKVVYWKPNPARGKDAVMLLREYHYKDADLWFMKFGLDANLDIMAVGNRRGEVSVFDLDADSERAVCRLKHPQCRSTIRQVSLSVHADTLVCCADDCTIWRYDLPE